MIEQIQPQDAFLKLQNANTILVDVRCDAEWNFVGQVDLSSFGGNVANVAWKNFPAMNLNPRFSQNLEKILSEKFAENAKDAQIIFMCRSGGRSMEAAIFIEQLGYKNCYNLVGGFEGDLDNQNHRANINGWKACNLAWRQS